MSIPLSIFDDDPPMYSDGGGYSPDPTPVYSPPSNGDGGYNPYTTDPLEPGEGGGGPVLNPPALGVVDEKGNIVWGPRREPQTLGTRDPNHGGVRDGVPLGSKVSATATKDAAKSTLPLGLSPLAWLAIAAGGIFILSSMDDKKSTRGGAL